MAQFELTILGCGSATPTANQNPTAQLLNMAERFFLIDCGEGTQRQLRRHKLRMGKINHIFISHLHGDHYFGLIGLISSYHLMNRKNALHIYGPPALEEILNLQMRCSNTELGFPLHFHATQADGKNLIFEDRRVEVYSFPLRHSIATTGFLFNEKPRDRNLISEKIREFKIPIYALNHIKQGADYTTEAGAIVPNAELTTNPPKPLSYAFCSDTAYAQRTADFVQGVDLLYHESTFLEEDKTRAKNTRHSTAVQAAKVAKAAAVRHLLLGHYSVRYDDLSLFAKEAALIFKNVTAAAESMRIIASADEISIH
jgi:ribonuclease Z